jgi:DNA ligase-1
MITPSLSGIMQELTRLKKCDENARKTYVLQLWQQLDSTSCLLFNKFITGGFRLGVGQGITTKALSKSLDRSPAEVTHALMGNWNPAEHSLESLLNRGAIHAHTLPYPFFLASPLPVPHAESHDPTLSDPSQHSELLQLGDRTDWLAEWKWDGIRVQIIQRAGVVSLWSRGEERIDDAFPELVALAQTLPSGIVIDGELLCGQFPEIRDFQNLQKRLGRAKPTARIQTQHPVFVYAYDLLEFNGTDIRQKPLLERRWILEQLIASTNHPALHCSPLIEGAEWGELIQIRNQARQYAAEGIMLKRAVSTYESGRKRGAWWKWKLDPMQLDAVMLYARPGHGRRSSLFTDYGMAIWDHSRNRLLSIAQVYSGLNDEEIREVDRWIKGHTTEKFGPVRTVSPELVFEIGFEGIQRSGRHKSGLALRFPRILRWRREKSASEADDLGAAEKLLCETTKPNLPSWQ